MYKTIIFDLDGTLLDSLTDIYTSVNVALSAYGLPNRTKEEVRAFVGNGIVKLMERAVGIVGYPQMDGVMSVVEKHYGEHCKDETKPYDGVMETLQKMAAAGIKTAVVSNKPDFAVKLLAEEYFQGLLLDAVGENESVGIRKKPAPDSLLAVMQTLGATAEETLYVGDSEVDIQTAQNAGVACLSVTWGFRSKEFLIESGATLLADTPFEMLQYCGL